MEMVEATNVVQRHRVTEFIRLGTWTRRLPGTKPMNCGDNWSEDVPTFARRHPGDQSPGRRLFAPSPFVTASRAGMMDDTSSTSNTRNWIHVAAEEQLVAESSTFLTMCALTRSPPFAVVE